MDYLEDKIPMLQLLLSLNNKKQLITDRLFNSFSGNTLTIEFYSLYKNLDFHEDQTLSQLNLAVNYNGDHTLNLDKSPQAWLQCILPTKLLLNNLQLFYLTKMNTALHKTTNYLNIQVESLQNKLINNHLLMNMFKQIGTTSRK